MYSGGMSSVMRSYGSWTAPVDRAQDHLRAAHLELEPLASHLLDEDGQLQLAASAHLERVGRLGGEELDRDVAQDLLLQARPQLAAGEVLPVPPGERRGVDAERHAQGRLVHLEARQGPRIGGIGQGVADRDLRQPRHRDDVARAGFLDVGALDPVGGLQRGHRARERDGATGLDDAGRVVRLLAHHRDPLADPDPCRS